MLANGAGGASGSNRVAVPDGSSVSSVSRCSACREEISALMADAHKYRTVYHEDGRSPRSWTGSVAVRAIGGGCTCGWQGQPRPDTADGGVQAFNDWWTDHYTPLVRPDPGELLILSHTGGMRCHYLAGRPVASGTRLELRLSARRWVPVRYEWSARADAAPRFYLELGGPWELFDEHGPETYVMLPLERTVFRWPGAGELDLLPSALEPRYGPVPDDAFRRALTPPPPSRLGDSLDFDAGRYGGDPLRDSLGGQNLDAYRPAAAYDHGGGGWDRPADSLEFDSGRYGRDPLRDSLELPGTGRTYRLQPGQPYPAGGPADHHLGHPGGPPPHGWADRGMTDPFGFHGSEPVGGAPGYHGGPPSLPPGPPVAPRPAGPHPGMPPSDRDSFGGRMGGIPMGNRTFVDGRAWVSDHGVRPVDTPPSGAYPVDRYPGGGPPPDRRPMDGHPPDRYPTDGRPMDGRPMDGRPMDARPMGGRPMDGRPIDMRPMDGRPMDGPPLRPPPGAVPELPPPGGDGPRRTRIGRPPSNDSGVGFPPGGFPPAHERSSSAPVPYGMNGSSSLNGTGGSIDEQVSRLMRAAAEEARREGYQAGPPPPGGPDHPRYQQHNGYGDPRGHHNGHGPEPRRGPGGERGRPPEDPWRRPYDG